MKKRILAMLLAIVMLIGALPMNAFATEATDPTITPCETEGCEYASGHEGNCSNYVAPTECETEGCTLGYGHEGDCGTSSNEEASAETADQAAAQNVIDLIAAIGEVTLESEAAITAAESAYNALTDAQKALVTNLDVLETAKSTYHALTVPAPVEAAADAAVYVTVNNKGVLGKANDGSIMVSKSVTVTDINADGVLSYDEALVAAHAAYNSADGYVTEGYEESGKTVTKLWGVDNGVNYLFFINGSPITMNVAESYVAAGNSLYISVLSEMTYGADWYTYFDKTYLTVKAGEEFTLILKGYQGRSENPAAVAVGGASVGTWQSGSFSAIEGKTTDENGSVTLSFDKAGTYYVTASGTVSDTVYGMTVDCPTMAPVCVVKVEAAEDTTPSAEWITSENVSVSTIHEDASAGNAVTLSFDEQTNTFSGKLSNYTELDAYNDGDISVVIANIPEGATAVLNNEAGEKVADFVNGVAKTTGSTVAASGKYTFKIVLTNGTKTESCDLILEKTTTMKWKGLVFEGMPAFSESVIYHGHPEGTLFQLDAEGNRTGATGLSDDCLHYEVYVNPLTTSVKPEGTKGLDYIKNSFSPDPANAKTSIYVDDEPVIENAPTAMALAMKIAQLKNGFELNVTKERTVLRVEFKISDTEVVYSTITFVRYVNVNVDTFVTMIEELDLKSMVYPDDVTSVDAVKGYYEALSDTQKTQIPAEIQSKFAAALEWAKPDRVPEKLEIVTAPAQVSYAAGDPFNPAGMELLATYSDGTTRTITPESEGFTVEPSGALTNETEVTFTYNTVKVSQPITVLTISWSGEGTEAVPYELYNAEDLQALYTYVASGKTTKGLHFKVMADITLPADWMPIGALIDPSVGNINSGKNVRPFSGTLDGNGKTITVPEGGLPLLGHVNGATVKNLNIYGKQIAGYGLVNNLEGVGLSGEAICIDNVTLKSGSSTLKSGLIGTYITNNPFAGCSAAFYVTIKNCTIEEGVVIGYNKDQSMIGSIAGRINGTIDNCVSYATVYGKDYVGGILGTRDNAMGTTAVTGCQFHGTVEASGSQVGGIVGGGYPGFAAPNGYKINIIDCSVSGSVASADKVGGIVGADTGVVQLWGTHTLKNNAFTGTVKATGGNAVGGIIGYYASLNKYDDISGNYYKSGCGADRGIGFVQYVDTSCQTHETAVGATYINTAEGKPDISGITRTDLNRTDDPLGADAANLAYTDAGAEPVDVTVTVSNKGVLALVNGTVAVKDTNSDGILTYHEALEAAHAAYCEGGYTATESEWGISVSEIWGVETYNSLFFRNGAALANHVGSTETSTVAEGDYLVVSVNKDDKYYGDRYSSFNAATKNVVVGKEFTLTLKADLSTGSTAVPNATIGIWNNGVFTPLEGKLTNDKGQVTLSFGETGTYIISAGGTISDTVQDWANDGAEVTADCPLIAPVCVVTVVEAPRLADLRVSKVWADSGDYYEMTPAFDPYVTEYTVHVPDYTSSIFPYVTQAETNVGTRTAYYCCVRGFGMFGWTTSNNISLSSNTYFGAVIYGTSSTSMSDEDIRYTVNISKYATLKSLDVDGTAMIDFDRGTNDGARYYVDGTAEGVKMTPTAHNAAYTVTINGTSVTSGSEYTLPYTWDENGQMKVSITVSGTNVEENTYTLVLEKMPLNDAPFIMKEGAEADYTVIDDASTVEALFVTASANGELAYQWYYNTTESNENGILIEGATASAYTPPITEDVIGTRYYYCVVTNTGKTENNVTASAATRITVDPDPTPVATITNPGSELTGYAWNSGYVYNVDDTATALNVTASSKAEGGKLSYRWVALDKAYNGGKTYINSEDAYTTSYTPSTDLSTANTDGKYYGCIVGYEFKGKSYTSWAKTGKTVTEGEGEAAKTYDVTGVYVFIKVNKAETPEITKQPVSATYLVGKSTKNLSVTASRADGGTLTYQWYVNDTNSTEGGTAIEGATTTSYKLGTATESGTKYYYCVVTNTIQGYTSYAFSEVAEITVQTAQDVIGEKLSGSGTEEDPFLIADAQDYQDVYDFVAGGQNFEGLYLKQTGENITLPENWTPIGTSKTRFSGTLDGNGKTVTVPEDGLPLFGYVNGAAVKNLNIYGKKIAGYGLVNNLEGVGMSGEAICIDNVTLKSGSSTLKSGLIGTYITSNMYAGCSATYYVTIKNCTIEEGVVIGYNKDQSMIGSVAGRVHGTIENCVSYAAVYGKDYVGGIVGTQDNALGGTVITDSQFHGKVEATGQHAGGIAGGGYSHSSAPNGSKININDCTVTGTITGADKVGGIIGGDTYVAQLWGGHSLKNNSFTGTVKATSGTYVGGIIGFYDSLNKYDDISGNYYKAGCGAAKGIGFVQYVDTSSQTHETQSGAVYFNTGDGTEECPTVAGCGWKAGHDRTDDPLGADAAKLCYTDTDTDPIAVELKVSGTYKTEYTTGEKLELTGIVLTVVYNDESEKAINLSDATVTGYDANKVGDQELTISYNGLTAAITVKVENPKGEIKVTVAIYGDSKHGDNGTVHTLAGGGLTTWVSAATYTVDSNSTVWDVLQKAFADNGITCNAGSDNSQGTVYISALTRNGVTLAEFDNGANSGWMYTLNGNHSDNGVAQQYLKDGDRIVFHYTDDYTKEQGSEGNDGGDKDTKAAEAVQRLIDTIGTVTLNSADEIEAAREAYDDLTYAQKQLVDNYAKLTAAESKYAQLKAADDEKKAAAVEDLIDKISAGSTTFEDDVKAAQKAYNALTADQKKLVDNYPKLANEEDKQAAEAVEKLIEDLGTITLDSEEDIKAAREAYDKLTEEQKALVENLADLEAAEEKLAQLKADAVTEDIYKTTGDYIENLGTPVPGSIGGEWMVIGLIRSDREVPGADDYYASVVKYVRENIDENERLHSAKSTDNSRLILALTAMGKDVTNVDGHNLLNGLNHMAFIQKQGINGPIWALIAFDSGNYPTPEGDVTREALLQIILDAQLADGGWALSGETSDADITGMAVQALAPYYESNADVKAALDEAIETLSKMQAADGSYGSIDGTSSESIAQVIVALAALGIDADKDERFVKNGISAVDALCAFYVEGGGFKHLMDGKLDGMATEQGYYALTAYFRMLDGKTSLYSMTDVMDMGGDVEAVEPTETLPTETEPTPTEPVQVEDDDKGGFPWWIIIALLIAGAVVVVIVNRKKFFASVR